jgi:hypothetical protein
MPNYEVQMSWKVLGSVLINAKNKKEAKVAAKALGMLPQIDAQVESSLRVDNVLDIDSLFEE